MAKRISATSQQYNIERERAARRIQRQVKVPISTAREMLPPVPKRVTQKSISKLKQIGGKHGKYTRNFISELYEEYIKNLTPKEFSDFYTKKAEFAKESVRRSEIARKRRKLPQKDTMPDYTGVEYEESTGDEIYVTLNEIIRIIENTLATVPSQSSSSKYVRKNLRESKQKATELKDYLYDRIRIDGREAVAKMLNAKHDEAIEAARLIIFGYKDGEKERGYATLNVILSIGGLDSVEFSTSQMDEMDDEEL